MLQLEGPAPVVLGPQANIHSALVVRHESVLTLPPVSESAITMRLPPVPLRSRAPWAIGAAASIAAIVAGLAFFVLPADEVHAVRPVLNPVIAVGATPLPPEPRRPEPVLASVRPLATFVIDEAEAEIDDVVILEDDVDEVVIVEERVETKADRRARARDVARKHMKKAKASRSMGDGASAKRHIQAALAALPSYGPAAAAMAEIQMKRRKYATALRYAKRASRAAPRKVNYMLLLGDAYFLAKKRKAAKKVWRKAAAYGSAKAKARLRR